MNLERIKTIVNSGLADWENLLLAEIATDKKAIPLVLKILAAERADNGTLIIDLNALLSKAHLAIEVPKVNKDGFIQKEIRAFYKEGRVSHCFNNMT